MLLDASGLCRAQRLHRALFEPRPQALLRKEKMFVAAQRQSIKVGCHGDGPPRTPALCPPSGSRLSRVPSTLCNVANVRSGGERCLMVDVYVDVDVDVDVDLCLRQAAGLRPCTPSCKDDDTASHIGPGFSDAL